jgi:hypothetical protein
MLKTGVLLSFTVSLFFSCSSHTENSRLGLYPIDSLITAQARYLSENNATLSKITKLGEQQDKVLVTPQDTTAWKKELEIFASLDIINKPVNIDLYKAEKFLDNQSNLRVISFTAKEDLPVKYLKIYYQDKLDKIRMIEAEYDESNALYNSLRTLTLEFQPVNNKTVLTSYSITGGQKMFLGDTVQYNVMGSLTIRN